MPHEGPPHEPLEQDFVAERGPITLEEAMTAYREGDRETVNAWYAGRERAADLMQHSLGRFQLSVDLARLQLGAGDNKAAVEIIQGVYEAVQQELIELDRAGSPLSRIPEKEEYQSELKKLFQEIAHGRGLQRRTS